ncbi:unnamed protein product [Ceratitis capitata]|uniref:(Mediterranean fruit fly) hypothetical protein n=1 Tax=Ceratitis capitata TaxID=7213 RepID=A0A811VGZ9_CERCA|nr:unnamed protein product [Ceratitis capitata]
MFKRRHFFLAFFFYLFTKTWRMRQKSTLHINNLPVLGCIGLMPTLRLRRSASGVGGEGGSFLRWLGFLALVTRQQCDSLKPTFRYSGDFQEVLVGRCCGKWQTFVTLSVRATSKWKMLCKVSALSSAKFQVSWHCKLYGVFICVN